jgi:succinate dehydrogenase / fumarate reductase, cytochrome b subunit
MTQRPLSPHLGIYRFAYTMALSIAHRIAGVWMAAGLCVLVYWLMSAADGELSYERATTVLSGWFFRLLLLGWLAAFCYHMLNGLRHLLWDAGIGLEKLQARRSALLVLVAALAGFLLLGCLFLCSYRGSP